MFLEFSVLSKTEALLSSGEGYILFFVNNISCLNCIQPDVCGLCTSGVNFKINDIHARALLSTARAADGFQGQSPWCIFFAILCCTTKNGITSPPINTNLSVYIFYFVGISTETSFISITVSLSGIMKA